LSYKKQRVALFIDAANLFYTQKKLGWDIDYEKLYKHFTNNFDIYNAFYFTGIKDNKGKWFHRKLNQIGYTIRSKEVKSIIDHATMNKTEKCNLDIEIVIDMFNTVDNYDKAVLFSGDSDFERAIELIRSRGKRILVVSTYGMIASELINAADKFIDLKTLKSQLKKKNIKKVENKKPQDKS